MEIRLHVSVGTRDEEEERVRRRDEEEERVRRRDEEEESENTYKVM